MKKALCLLMVLILVLAAAACEAQQQPSVLPTAPTQSPVDSPSSQQDQTTKPPQSSDDIQMTVKEQNVAGDVEAVTLTITNASDKPYTYGAMSLIEAEKDGEWEEVEPIDTLMWIEIAYTIEPGQSNEDRVTIKKNFGTLAPGSYRIVKTFTDPDGTSLTAYGLFTVE